MLPLLNTGESTDTLGLSEDRNSDTSEVSKDNNPIEAEEMSMAAPISITQPVKDWIAVRKENVRPMTMFFNSANFQVGDSGDCW